MPNDPKADLDRYRLAMGITPEDCARYWELLGLRAHGLVEDMLVSDMVA